MGITSFEKLSYSLGSEVRNVLLAEDMDDAYVLFVQAVSGISSDINIMRLHHGYNLLSMLQTDVEVDAIFLDINMPYKNGLLILKEIRAMEYYKHTPVIILSGSTYSLNITQAYQLKATFFAKKTQDYKHLEESIRTIFSSPYFQSKTQPPWEEFVIS